MKKLVITMVVALLALPLGGFAQEEAAPQAGTAKTFGVYSDYRAVGNHYIPSGFMGDYGDIAMNDQSADKPHSGTSCIKFEYKAKRTQNQGWAGVYWQNPANNWGTKKGGFDLTGMTKLTFWARGAKGGEIIEKIKVGGIAMGQDKPYPDSSESEFGPIELTDAWQQYTVNIAGKDLSYISGGLAWITKADLNPDGCTFYMDDIEFVADSMMKPEGKKSEGMPFYVYSDSRSAGNHYVPSGWMPGQGTGKDVRFEGSNKEDPYLGDTSIKLQYKDASGNGWAGIYWLHASVNPSDSWGKKDVGYDLSKATKLTFWARGAKGGERVETFKTGGVQGEYSDSDAVEIGPVILNRDWTQYTIDLAGKDMSYIIGGFCWATNMEVQKDESKQDDGSIIFYLDEIRFE
ncbi:MAG: hypothetical protein KBA46_02435 [Candidatus Omnitrophica bacterium]|nr:hypothetical protein [Candidatus Omnitrophota bacterium]